MTRVRPVALTAPGVTPHAAQTISLRELRSNVAAAVAEGMRWSADGEALLLLCRNPGRDPYPLEVWLYQLGSGTSAPLITGLVSDPQARGFGFYGAQPSLFSIVAWSRAAN